LSPEKLNHRAILDVLLVDDDPDHRWLTRDALAGSDRACCVHEATSVEEAMAMITRPDGQREWVNPDVIFLDLELPGADGLTLLSQVKMDPDLKDIKVIIVTGRNPATEPRKEILFFADGIIRKTQDIPGMMEALRMSIESCCAMNTRDSLDGRIA
jgi:CheY-like chemotaxis protein